MDRKHSIRLLVAILLSGFVLRVCSFHWNSRLQGDVNLFALTAREFVEHARLAYPMKYEFSDHVDYRVLHSPASEHPLLVPFLAGVVGKLFRTDDTFAILKIICETFGFLFLTLVAYVGFRKKAIDETLVATAGIALAPMLVDFSANGSVYILSTFLIASAIFLLCEFRFERVWDYVLVGLLIGVALQVHGSLISILFSSILFFSWKHSQTRYRFLLLSLTVALLVLSPTAIWNYAHFKTFWYSHDNVLFLRELGLAKLGIYGETITTRTIGTISLSATLKTYLAMVFRTASLFLYGYAREIGPFCLILVWLGLVRLFKQAKDRALVFLLLPIVHALTIFFLAPMSFRYRFILPVLPEAYIVAGFGFIYLYREKGKRLLGWIGCAGTLAWGLPHYFAKPPTKYSAADRGYAARYDDMKRLALELRNREQGVVLGYSMSLDGGIETVYWNRFPFVAGRDFDQKAEIVKLIRDFDVRYIWSDGETLTRIRAWVPDAKVILQNDSYSVSELQQ